jgi:hypothetical protein
LNPSLAHTIPSPPPLPFFLCLLPIVVVLRCLPHHPGRAPPPPLDPLPFFSRRQIFIHCCVAPHLRADRRHLFSVRADRRNPSFPRKSTPTTTPLLRAMRRSEERDTGDSVNQAVSVAVVSVAQANAGAPSAILPSHQPQVIYWLRSLRLLSPLVDLVMEGRVLTGL